MVIDRIDDELREVAMTWPGGARADYRAAGARIQVNLLHFVIVKSLHRLVKFHL